MKHTDRYVPCPPLSLEDSTAPRAEGVSRRTAILGCTALVMGGAAIKDEVAGRVEQPRIASYFRKSPVPAGFKVTPRHDVATIVLPGFNAEASDLAINCEPVLWPFGDFWTAHYGAGDEDFIGALAYGALEHLATVDSDQRQQLQFWGHSMGGVFAVHTALRLHEKYDLFRLNKIQRLDIRLDCSPFDLADIKGGRGSAVELLDVFDGVFAGGPTTRWGVESLAGYFLDGKPVTEAIRDGYDLAHPKGSEKYNATLERVASEYLNLSSERLAQAMGRLAAIDDINVRFTYFGPGLVPGGRSGATIRDDGTVNTPLAVSKWRQNSQDLSVVGIPNGGHGIGPTTRAAYAEYIRQDYLNAA